MRFSCHKAELLQAIQVVSRVLPAQTSEQLFTNILLSAEPDRLCLFATQHQVSIRREVAMIVPEPGRIAVPGALFAEILQQIQTARSDTVDVTVSPERRMVVSGEGAVYRLSGIDPVSFPAMPEPVSERSFVIGADKLRELIRRVVIVNTGSVGASFDEMLIEVHEGQLAFVATDSVRLAVSRCPLEAATPSMDTRLPLQSMAELGKILPADGDVRVTLGSHQVGFEFARTLYVARTADKVFPNYRSILPKDHPRYITVEAKGLADALKGVAPLARANKHRVRLAASVGKVVISSSSAEVGGDAEREVEAELSGEPIELSFNAKYILDFLGAAETPKVRLGVTAASLPATFRPEGEGAADYVYLLMPINL